MIRYIILRERNYTFVSEEAADIQLQIHAERSNYVYDTCARNDLRVVFL